MDEEAIATYITETFDGLDVVTASGDWYFYWDPDRSINPARRLPFATIVTSDAHDSASNLNRPGVFRLNIGVGKETYQSRFGSTGSRPGSGAETSEIDFTALDQLLPHPVYRQMFWVCVLNPSAATFESLRPLLAEAYDLAIQRTTRATRRNRDHA